MIRTPIQLFAEHNNPLLINATKCYRDALEIQVTNFLHIRKTTTILRRRRLSIPREQCLQARQTNKIDGHELTFVTPGLMTTDEVEDSDHTLPLWGTNKYLRSIYTVKTGQLASFDGKSITSSFGNLENCTLDSGSCLTQEYTIVWDPIQTEPFCRYILTGEYDAFITLQYIVLPQSELVFRFSDDYIQHAQLTENCHLGNNYLTTANYIITFPYIPADVMIKDYIVQTVSRQRTRRATQYLTDKYGRKSRFEVVPPEPVPIIRRLFGIDSIADIPRFRTRPIVEGRILLDMQRWNVTNDDLARQARFYNIEDPCLLVLRTIRYAEYRMKQLYRFQRIHELQNLNYAEKNVRDLQIGISPIFDAYLEKEFGKVSFTLPSALKPGWEQKVPYFEVKPISAITSPTTTTQRPTTTMATATLTRTTPPHISTPSSWTTTPSSVRIFLSTTMRTLTSSTTSPPVSKSRYRETSFPTAKPIHITTTMPSPIPSIRANSSYLDKPWNRPAPQQQNIPYHLYPHG